MQFRQKNSYRVGKKLLVFYIIIIFLFSFHSMIGLSEPPEIDIQSPDINSNYTTEDNVNVSVFINSSDGSYCSSFINWNHSLCGYWNFEEYTGSYVTDISGNNNNAAYNGVSNANITSQGKYGKGISFNGSSSDYLDCGSNFNFDDEISLELWFKEYETTFNTTFSHPDSGKDDYGMAVEQTSDGGYIIACLYNNTDLNSNNGDLMLIKTDSNGNIVQNSTPYDFRHPGGMDKPYDIEITSDGDYVVVGETLDIGVSNSDLFVKKYNSDLSEIQNLEIIEGSVFEDKGYSIKETIDGNYIITGSYRELMNEPDIWVLRINNQNWTNDIGNIIDINNTYGNNLINEYGQTIIQSTDGNYIILGQEEISTNSYTYKINITKISPTDNDENSIIWSKNSFGWGRYDWGYDIQETQNDNGLIVTGFSNRTNNGGSDLFLLKTNNNGEKQWEQKFNLSNKKWNQGFSVYQTYDECYIITGHIGNIEAYKSIHSSDLLIIKANESGTKQWHRIYDGHGWTMGRQAIQSTDGGYAIIGQINDTIDTNIRLLKTDIDGNITNSNNNQIRYKTLIGAENNSINMILNNGTIQGYINNHNVFDTDSLYNLTQYYQHYALTYNRTDGIKLYKNKTLVKQDNSDYGTINSAINNIKIGSDFSGIIDEVKIWNRTLSNEEINASYQILNNSYHKTFENINSDNSYDYSIYAINENGEDNQADNTISKQNPPTQTGEAPYNTKINVDINPELFVMCNDTDSSDILTATWYYNESDNWWSFAINNSFIPGENITQTNNNFSNHSSTYYWSVNLTDGINWQNNTYRFTTRAMYTPDEPQNLTATQQSSSSIKLTWDKGNYSDKTIILRKQGNYPNNISDATSTTVYNDTGSTFTDNNGLTSSTKYCYRAWSWNSTDSTISNINSSVNATTASQVYNPGSNQNTEDEEEEENTNENDTEEDEITINIISPEPNQILYNGKPKIEARYSTNNGTIDTSNISFTIDNIDKTNMAAINSEKTVYTPSSNMNLGTHTIILKVPNTNRNVNSKTWSFKIEGYSIDEQKNSTINITEEKQINATNSSIIVKVILSTKTNQENITTKIIDLGEEKPSDLQDIVFEDTNITEFEIISFVKINLEKNNTYLEEENINSSDILFKINITKIKELKQKYETNNSKLKIQLLRYHNNSWTILDTNEIDQDDDYYYYTSLSPGFSTFAVVGSKVVEKGEAFDPDEPEIPWVIIIGFIISVIIILIIVLFKAGYIYIEKT